MSLKKIAALAFLASFAFCDLTATVAGSTCANGGAIVSLPKISQEKTVRTWTVEGRKHEIVEKEGSDDCLHQIHRWVDKDGNNHETDQYTDKDETVHQCHRWVDKEKTLHETKHETAADGKVKVEHVKKDCNGVVTFVDDDKEVDEEGADCGLPRPVIVNPPQHAYGCPNNAPSC